MSALVDRITEVLRAYYPVSPTYSQDWAEGVAELVAEALQLTEERTDRYGHRGAVPYHRWVSRWTAVEDQP